MIKALKNIATIIAILIGAAMTCWVPFIIWEMPLPVIIRICSEVVLAPFCAAFAVVCCCIIWSIIKGEEF